MPQDLLPLHDLGCKLTDKNTAVKGVHASLMKKTMHGVPCLQAQQST